MVNRPVLTTENEVEQSAHALYISFISPNPPRTHFQSIAETMTQPITHIVLFKYRSNIPWSAFEAHFDSFMALKTKSLHPKTGKPLIQSLKAGKNRSWEPFSKGMTHGFVLEFASQDDLDYYLTTEPVHREFSKNAGPLIEDSVVLDIVDGVLFGSPAKRPLGAGEYRGACHCGGVTWTAKLSTAEHVLCHCATCQKLGGGPYSCNQIIPREDLVIVSGTPKVYTYQGASGMRSSICPGFGFEFE